MTVRVCHFDPGHGIIFQKNRFTGMGKERLDMEFNEKLQELRKQKGLTQSVGEFLLTTK